MLRVCPAVSFFVAVVLTAAPFAWSQSDSLNEIWRLETGLSGPESVVYDAGAGCLYVSNVDGGPLTKDDSGYISKVSLDGALIEERWAEGLWAPKGLAISNGFLYVADINGLSEISLETGIVENRYVALYAGMLNDVAAAPDGTVYVSDMLNNAVWQLKDGEFTPFLIDNALQHPNGLFYQNGSLIVGSWGDITQGFETETLGHLKSLSLDDKSIQSLGGVPVGNLDGVESDGAGAWFVTDWVAGALFRIMPNGEYETLLDTGPGSADLLYMPETQMLYLPMMNDDALIAYRVQ